jgi:phage shock protein PspC (stress-responsive transcriptional regulator)
LTIDGIATWLQLESTAIATATKHGGIQRLIRAVVSLVTAYVVAAAFPPAQSEREEGHHA